MKRWSHPPGLNRRPADYEAENPPLSPFVLVGIRPVWPRLLVQFGGFWMGNLENFSTLPIIQPKQLKFN